MPEFRFLDRMEHPPEQRIQVYRLRTPQVNEDSVRRMAQRFGLEGNLQTGTLQQDRFKMTYTEGHSAITLYRASGGIRYRDIARWQVDDQVSNLEMTDGEAIRIAQRYIRQLELVPQNDYQFLELTHLHVGVLEQETGRSEERRIDAGVAFQRVMDNVSVEGGGGKLLLYIDHRGELTGVDRIWREIERVHRPFEQLQVRSPQAVEEDLRAYYGEQGRGVIEVEAFRFGYYELGWEDEQQYLQPAYIVPLRLISPNERFRSRTDYVVPAVTNSFEFGRLTPLPRLHDQQPSRQS